MQQSLYKIAYGSEQLPLKIGASEIPCFILEHRQFVLTKTGVQKALGYDGKSEDWLFDLLSSINKFYPIPGELFDALESPVLFEMNRQDGSRNIIKGIYPDLLQTICKTIQNAKNDGYLSVSQLKHAKAAETILNFLSENDLTQAIETATGFVFLKESGKNYLQDFLLQETGDAVYQWTKTIRDDFYEKILELNQLNWIDLRENYLAVSRLLHEIIYSRLPDNLVGILRTQKPKRSYKLKSNTQDLEHPELKAYLSEALSLLKAAGDNWPIFTQLLNRIHPKNNLPELRTVQSGKTNEPELSVLNSHLKKGVLINRVPKKYK